MTELAATMISPTIAGSLLDTQRALSVVPPPPPPRKGGIFGLSLMLRWLHSG